MGLQDKLILGDLESKIDFGYAKEYVEAAWRILQLSAPDDFVIGTGEVHSVREFLEEAFRAVGLNASDFVESDPKLFRPGKTSTLAADYSKAKKAIGFEPKVTFTELVQILIDHDKEELQKERGRQG